MISTFYGKNRPKEVIHVSKGMRHGKTIEYHENGQLKLKINYKDNKPDGLAEGWHEDGTIAFSKYYKQGDFVGEQKEFFKGNKGLHTLYTYSSDGVLNGDQKVFYPNGQIQSLMSYTSGLLDGKKISYGEGGEIVEEAFYRKGKIEGNFVQKDSLGREMVFTYVNNIKEGPCEVYYPLHPKYGKIKALEATYKKGFLEGDVEEYNQAGQLIAISPFVKGCLLYTSDAADE